MLERALKPAEILVLRYGYISRYITRKLERASFKAKKILYK